VPITRAKAESSIRHGAKFAYTRRTDTRHKKQICVIISPHIVSPRAAAIPLVLTTSLRLSDRVREMLQLQKNATDFSWRHGGTLRFRARDVSTHCDDVTDIDVGANGCLPRWAWLHFCCVAHIRNIWGKCAMPKTLGTTKWNRNKTVSKQLWNCFETVLFRFHFVVRAV